MGSSAEILWAAIVKDLEHIVESAEGSDTHAGAAHSVFVHIMRLSQQPPYPRATWKKLVSDLKVPIKLSALCKDLHLQRSTPLTAAALDASTRALYVFLRKANCEGVLQPSTQLCATILQQIRQSGLLQHLADMMANAAHKLVLMTQSAQQEPGTQPPGTMSPASEAAAAALGASSSTRNRDGHHNRGLSSKQQADCLGYAGRLLTILSLGCGIIRINDDTFSKVPAAAYTAAHAAALRLAYTGLQHVSAVLPQLQQEQRGQNQGPPQQQQQQAFWWPKNVNTYWLSAGKDFFVSVFRLLTSISIFFSGHEIYCTVAELLREVPHLRPLLLSPDLLPAFAAMVAAIALLLAAKQDLGSCQLLSSSSDGSIQRPAQQLELELSPAQLQLCDVLGVCGQTLRWAAGAASSNPSTIEIMEMCSGAYRDVVTYYTEHVEDMPPVQLLQMAKIDLLLPSFVLPWLDSIPTSSPDWGKRCQTGCHFCSECYSATRARLEFPDAVGNLHMLQGLQQDDAASHTLQQWLQQPPSTELLVEVLPVVVCLCKASLHQLQQSSESEGTEEQSSTARNKTTAAASSLGGSSQLAIHCCCTALHNWVMLLHSRMTGCSSVVTQPTAPSSSIGSSRVVRRPMLASQDLFRQHAADLLTVLEGTVRYVALPTAFETSKTTTMPAVVAVANMCQGGLEGQPAPLTSLAHAAGPGSRTQQQLYGLLCSLVKLSGCVPQVVDFECIYAMLRYTAAHAALMLLVAPTPDVIAAFQVASSASGLWNQEPVVAACNLLHSVEMVVGSMVVSAAVNATAAGVAKPVDVLPSLVILGRCCLQWVQELEAEVHTVVQQSAEGLGGDLQQTSVDLRASAMCCRKVGQVSSELHGMEYFVLVAQQWLQAGSHSAELSAAGYAAEAVLQQLEQLLAAVRATQVTSSNSSSSSGKKETPHDVAANAAVTKHLRSTGLALCALAVPCMCNYPGCTNMSGLTELGTVSGRSCMCGGCRVAHYCSRAHQKQHWKQHKPVCAALAAARVAVVPAAAPVS